MMRLTGETCQKISKREEKRSAEKEYWNFQKRYCNILTHGEKELPPILEKQTDKRGKVAKFDAHNLWERFQKHELVVLFFVRKSHVSFIKNRAERDLRRSKVQQRVLRCFRVKKYAVAYCRISSYL